MGTFRVLKLRKRGGKGNCWIGGSGCVVGKGGRMDGCD